MSDSHLRSLIMFQVRRNFHEIRAKLFSRKIENDVVSFKDRYNEKDLRVKSQFS